MELCDDAKSLHVTCLAYEFLKVIDILVDSALPLVVSHGFELHKGKLSFILQAELSNEGFMKGFPGGVFNFVSSHKTCQVKRAPYPNFI